MELSVRVGYGPRLEDYNIKENFIVKFKPLTRVPLAPVAEAKLAAEEISRSLPGKPIVCFSGGLDSEIVALSFLQAGVDFEVATLRFKNEINEDEIKFARRWCEKYGIKQTFYDLDILHFIESGDYKKYHLPYYTPSLESCALLWLLDQIRENVVWGGEAFRAFHRGNQLLLQSISEMDAVVFRFMAKHSLPGVPNFHFFTPELAWSFLRTSLRREDQYYFDDHLPGHLAEKISFYKDSGFEILDHADRHIKLHGFEGVRRHFDKILKEKNLGDYTTYYREPFTKVFPLIGVAHVDIPREDVIAKKILSLSV